MLVVDRSKIQSSHGVVFSEKQESIFGEGACGFFEVLLYKFIYIYIYCLNINYI